MEELNTTTQVENLKLNVTNIKSFLIKSNTQVRRIDSKKTALIGKEVQDRRRAEAEQKAETKIKPGMGFGKKILSGVGGMVMSIKDRIINFFGYLVLGFLVDKLPIIIEKVSSFIKTVGPFVVGTVKALGVIASGIGSVYNSISSLFKPDDAKKNIQQSEKELRGLDREIDTDGIVIPEMPFAPMAPGNMFPQQTPQASPQISPPQSSPEGSIPKIQKRNKGGAVNKQSRANQQPKRTTIGNEKTNPVKLFSKTSEQNKETTDLYDKNMSKFEDIVKTLKTIKKFGGDGNERPNENPGEGPRTRPASDLTPVAVRSDEVIGSVGYTGTTVPAGPGGSHIHIENYTNPGASIPDSVKNNILVSGIPMTQRLRFTSGIGMRWGSMHRGEDYAGDPDQKITLQGGLKYVQFIPNRGDGYGNRVIIESNGVQYTLNHLNSGPDDETSLLKRQQEKIAERKKQEREAKKTLAILKGLEKKPLSIDTSVDDPQTKLLLLPIVTQAPPPPISSGNASPIQVPVLFDITKPRSAFSLNNIP